MKKQLRDAWVKALRSGEYEQTTGELQGYDGHCCLGVLCEIAAKRGYRVKRNKEGLLTGQLLDEQTKRLNALVSDRQSNELTDMNDGGRGFSAIANWIEKNFPVEP